MDSMTIPVAGPGLLGLGIAACLLSLGFRAAALTRARDFPAILQKKR